MTKPRKQTADLKSDMGPFSILPEWVRTAEIPEKAKSLYGYLQRMSNLPKGAFPSVATMAQEIRCSDRSVIRHLNELVKIGAVTKEERHEENGRQTSNRYIVHLVQQVPSTTWKPGEWDDLP